MKIIFLGLASTFTPGLNYQDNVLCGVTVSDGHQVTYISNPEKFVDGVIVPTVYEDTVLPDGLRLIRLPYCKIGPNLLTVKFRKFRGVYEILEQTQPDVIFCHNTQYWSILDVLHYKKAHPQVKLYADTHTDANNSGTNWVSLHILHRIYYRYLTRRLLPYLDKYFYVSEETRQFSIQNYGVPESIMEFYPLGGKIFSPEDHAEKRERRREELGIGEYDVLFVHSGKLDALKRTEELLRAFAAVPDKRFHLAVLGSIPEDMKPRLQPLIEADSRVEYLGWKSADELLEYLCACDVYCQPGSQSATMQNAVCCGCSIMLYPHSSYVKDFDYGNIIWTRDQADIELAFRSIADGSIALNILRENSRRCARELLDYRALAARLYR